MSSAAREEAIEIVREALTNGRHDEDRAATAERIVDKLLKTHAISRNAPRVHRPTDPAHPMSQVIRAGEGQPVGGE